MRLFWTLVFFLTAAMPLLGRQAPAAQADPVGVVVDSIDLKDVSTDRVRFEIRSHVTADRHLQIKRVRFERMYLGSLPIYLSPVDERLERQCPLVAPGRGNDRLAYLHPFRLRSSPNHATTGRLWPVRDGR